MVPRRITSVESTALVLILAMIALYCMPVPAVAQSTGSQSANPQGGNPPAVAQPAQSAQQPPAANNPQSNSSQTQQPVTTYPDATAANQQSAPAATSGNSPDAPQPKAQQNAQQTSEPQGAATAEKVTTAGGAAAKPAGVAIAPAKQHQTRSLLIKVGAALAAGAAAGTVYALSRGTSSTPPGATSPGSVQKR